MMYTVYIYYVARSIYISLFMWPSQGCKITGYTDVFGFLAWPDVSKAIAQISGAWTQTSISSTLKNAVCGYPFSHNHGSGKWPYLKGNYYWRDPFSTSMSMGGRVYHYTIIC